MRTTLRIAVVVALAAAGLSAADPTYVGKWKLNVDKSDFGQLTVTYESTPGGGYKSTMDGLSYTFMLDEKEVPTPWGTTASWKSLDANSWRTTQRTNGKVIGVDTLKLSSDGRTLSLDSKMTKANGETADSKLKFERVSGGPGLDGTWKASKMTSASPTVLEVVAKGTDGLVIKFVDQNAMCSGKLDGKDYPAMGPMWPMGWTCTLSRSGDSAFNVTWKKEGKAMYESLYTASDDGKTLTETGGAANTTEKIKAVYDRQ